MKSIFIIAGEKGSGKTSFLIQLSQLLQLDGFVVDGFVATHEFESDCYQIKNIKTNKEVSLMQRVATYEKRPHHFKLFPEGVDAGNRWVEELLIQSPDIVVIDEIGGYELAGELWCNSFTEIVSSPLSLIFTTKEKHLEEVMKKWKIDPSQIFYSADFKDSKKAFEQIKNFL